MKINRDGWTFGGGALVGLMASNRPLYIFAAGLVAGCALASSFYFYAQLREGLRSLVSRRERGLRSGVTPVYDVPRKRADR